MFILNFRFVVVEPINRPALEWYVERQDVIMQDYEKRIKDMKLLNVNKIPAIVKTSQVFEQDQIHLTIEAGKNFVQTILYFAGEVFDAEMVDLEESENEMEVTAIQVEEVEKDESGPIAGPPVQKTTEEKLDLVMLNINERRHNDNMVFARIREELDFAANVKKEDRLIVTGLVSDTAGPTGGAEYKGWLKELAGATLETVVPGSASKIMVVNPGRREGREVPMCEVKMENKEIAAKIRREFGRLRKEDKIQGRLFVANSVTLATRVRLDIMKAMAKKNQNPNEEWFVMGFTSRPLLQIKKKSGYGQLALTFVDALLKFGKGLKAADLGTAYGRAGTTFEGQMEQNFVVLKDKMGKGVRGPSRGRGRPTGARGNKRPLDQSHAEAGPSGSNLESLAKRSVRGGRTAGAGGRGTPGK